MCQAQDFEGPCVIQSYLSSFHYRLIILSTRVRVPDTILWARDPILSKRVRVEK